ncbi:substrate-binding periplasmic protein [Spirochaeta isovalerica]|nr:transporter substrate-binding domain-containing protein [Spirochaeta isovalerica]
MPKTLFFLILLLPSALVAKDPLQIVTDIWAPYVYRDEESAAGFDYEVMDAVLKRMEVDYELKILPWKRCIYLIENREADAILDISMNDNRLETMIFPEEPISSSESVLFYRKGTTYRFAGLSDLDNLIVGTILGYEYNRDFLEAENFKKEPVTSLEQNIGKLLLGRIDMFISNRSVGLFTIMNMGKSSEITYLPEPVSGGLNYLAFSKVESNVNLAKAFSEELKRFKTTAEYRTILARYGQNP